MKINFFLPGDFKVCDGLFHTNLLTFSLACARSYLVSFLYFFILLTFMTIFSFIQPIFGFCALFLSITHESCLLVVLGSVVRSAFTGDCMWALTYSIRAFINLEIASFLQVSLLAEEGCYVLVRFFELVRFFCCRQGQMPAFYDSNDYS